MIIGYKIKEVRESLKMTQEELAEKSGVSRGTISALENGTAHVTTCKTLVSLAEALNTKVDDLLPIADSCPGTSSESMSGAVGKQQRKEFASLVSKLDEAETDAIGVMIASMLMGKSNEEAIKAANKVLIANGKKPLPYPLPTA